MLGATAFRWLARSLDPGVRIPWVFFWGCLTQGSLPTFFKLKTTRSPVRVPWLPLGSQGKFSFVLLENSKYVVVRLNVAVYTLKVAIEKTRLWEYPIAEHFLLK